MHTRTFDQSHTLVLFRTPKIESNKFKEIFPYSLLMCFRASTDYYLASTYETLFD